MSQKLNLQPKQALQKMQSSSSKKKKQNFQMRFEFLTEERVEEATHLYTQSFLAMNTMWKQMGATYKDVYSVTRGKMIASSKAGWLCSMVNASTGEVAAIAPNLDLIDYVSMESMPHNSQFLQRLGKYASKLETEYLSKVASNSKRGDAIYNFGGAVRPQYANGGISTKFWSQGILSLKTAGYKQFYVRATNRITTKLIAMFGGKVVKTVNIDEPGVEGEFIELMLLDLSKLSYTTLSKYFEDLNPSLENFQ